MNVEYITWDDILPIWTHKLWPNRKSKIDPASAIAYPKDMLNITGPVIDMENKKFVPYYMAIRDKEIISVNSVVMCADGSATSRGLWVNGLYRGQGISKLILTETVNIARNNNASFIWTIPRKTSLPAYQSVGFKQTSVWFDEGMEFGPNCYARLDL